MGQSGSAPSFDSADGQQFGFTSGGPPLPLPAWGAEAQDGYDSDSDVEYDKAAQSMPSPAHTWADVPARDDGAGALEGVTAATAAETVPPWAIDGAADEPCMSRLQLQFVYGTRGADCRHNAFFVPTGEIAFHAASLVVVHDPRRHAQRFLRGHDGEVRCLAVHPRGTVLASGQAAGGTTEICIWQLDASEPAMVLCGPHVAGVALLEFSRDGERLASVGADRGHLLVVWDWRQGTALASHEAHNAPLFGLSWSAVDQSLATVGVGCVSLWALDESRGFTVREAHLNPPRPGRTAQEAAASGRRGHPDLTFLCCAYLHNGLLIAGNSQGEVWCWSGTALCARFRAHDGPVFALEVEANEGWMFSGGKDGRLRLWSPEMWPVRSQRTPSASGDSTGAPAAAVRLLDLRKLAVALADSAGRPRLLGTPCVRAIHWVGTTVLLGTRAGELLTLDYSRSAEFPDVTLLLQGHCHIRRAPRVMRPSQTAATDTQGASPYPARAGAMAAHPTLPLLASSSTDLSLRLWSVVQRQMEAMRMLPTAATALAFAPAEEVLVCALGESGLLLVDSATLHDILSVSTAIGSGSPTSLGFAPDGALLAVGCTSGAIEIRTASSNGNWDVLGVCVGHPAPVLSLDWADGGAVLQSNCASRQLLYWDVRTCTRLDAAVASEATWASANCTVQWALSGVGEMVHHPSLLACSRRSHGGGAVAVGCHDGDLMLVGYPTVSSAAANRRYPAHRASIGGLAWSCDDGVLLSLADGGELFQWCHVGGEPSDNGPAAAAAAAAEEASYDSDVESELLLRSLTAAAIDTETIAPLSSSSTAARGPPISWSGGGEAGAANPEAGSSALVGARVGGQYTEVHAPTGWRAAADAYEAPPDGLSLEWVYGCRGHDAHSNVHWTASGEILLHAAAVGVVFDPKARAQRFFTAHSAEILCAAPHPSGVAVATGQADPALACVWDSRTCETLAVLRGVHSVGVCALAFDSSGERLATVGLEPTHRVAIWEWRRGLLLARLATGAARLFAVAFRPSFPMLSTAEPLELAAVGVRTASFISGLPSSQHALGANLAAIHDDSQVSAPMRARRAQWGGRAPQATLLCVAYSSEASSVRSGECYTGTARGDILTWRERVLLRVVRAHSGPVFSMSCAPPSVAAAAGQAEVLFSAGKGGKVRRWGSGLTPLGSIDLREPLAALTDAWGRPLIFRGDSPAVRSLSVDGAGRVLIGTSGGEVALLVPASGELSLLLQGHSARRGEGWPGRLAALATHPTRPVAASTGDDGCLRLWSLSQHAMLAMRPLPGPAAAAAFSPDGTFLAIGLDDGGWLLLDADSLRPTDSSSAAHHAAQPERAARGAIGSIRFSPDGALLAIGGADGSLTVCAHVGGGWAFGHHRVASASGHCGTVLQLDWSEEPVVLSSAQGQHAGGGGTECWLLRSCAAEAAAADASAGGASELFHWELACERERHGASPAGGLLPADGYSGGATRALLAASASAAAPAVSSAAIRRVAHAISVRDVAWATETCSLSWGALATTTAAATQTGNLRPVARSHEGEVLAAADARGGVSLYRWPACSANASSKKYGGHARAPVAVAFSHDDALLLTCGGADLTLLQWRHTPEESRLFVTSAGDELAIDLSGGGMGVAGVTDGYDSDVASDFKPLSQFSRPKARGQAAPPSRRAFLEASSYAQAARASGVDITSLAPPDESPLGALAASSSLMAIDELVQKQRFSAVRPWLRGLELPSATAGMRPPTERAPINSLELDWLHGARTHDVRASLHLTAQGELLYPAAAMVVLMGIAKGGAGGNGHAARAGQQRYYKRHTSAVLCTTLHPDGATAASGALGADAAVHVWDSATLSTVAVLRHVHTGGVAALAFSGGEGSLLASVDLAQSPLLALWNWRRGELIASARAGRQRVLGVAFNPISGALVSFGSGTLRFWSADGATLKSRRGLFGATSSAAGPGARTILSVAFSADGEHLLAGTADGCILQWSMQGHVEEALSVNRQQPLFALHCGPDGLVAAGKGGRLLWWPGRRVGPLQLSDARSLDLSAALGAASDIAGRPLAHLGGQAPCVRTLTVRSGAVCFATRGGELWQMPLEASMSATPATASILVQGHSAARRSRWQGEACALAIDPTNGDAFATGGDDGTVRIWSVSERRQVAMRALPLAVTALAYTSDGAHIAAGCGAAGVYVLYADSLCDALVFSLAPHSQQLSGGPPQDVLGRAAIVFAGHGVRRSVATSAIQGFGSLSAIAYSPDDSLVAVAGADGIIELLGVGAHYRRLRACHGHSSAVLHLDWSADGRYLQSCCGRCELMYWEAASGARVLEVGTLRDVVWATWTCPLGLPVQGIYPKMSDGSDITAAHRSPDGRLLVTADDFRKVNLFNHPSGPGSAACRSVAVHAAHVASVRFTADGKHVVSVGGPDLSVGVWRVAGRS